MIRRRFSPTKRAKLRKTLGNICHLCGGEIHVGEAWDIEHEIALELGGADDISNWRLAHIKCHKIKTATQDIPAIAKAKRREQRHNGSEEPRYPFRGWRRFNGDPVKNPKLQSTS